MMTFNLLNHLLKSFLSQTFCRKSISLWKVLAQSKYETACSSVSAFINLSSDSRKAFLQDLSKSSETIGKHGVFFITQSNRNNLIRIKGFQKWAIVYISFSNKTPNFFFKKFWPSYILDIAKIPKTVKALRVLPQKSTRKFGIRDIWALKNHVLVNMLLCSSHFTKVHEAYIGT